MRLLFSNNKALPTCLSCLCHGPGTSDFAAPATDSTCWSHGLLCEVGVALIYVHFGRLAKCTSGRQNQPGGRPPTILRLFRCYTATHSNSPVEVQAGNSSSAQLFDLPLESVCLFCCVLNLLLEETRLHIPANSFPSMQKEVRFEHMTKRNSK